MKDQRKPALRRAISLKLVVTTGLLLVLAFFIVEALPSPLSSSRGASPSDVLYDGSAGLAAGQIPFGYQSYIRPHVTVVPDPTGLPRNVMRFAIADSDRPYSGASNPRADFETSAYFTNGSDLYYSQEFLLPSTFPALTSSGWMQVSEVYGAPYGGSPPVGIDLVPGANGRPRPVLRRDATHGYDQPWVGPTLDTGWHQVIVHTRSATDNSGFVQIWLDGQPQTMTNGTTTINYQTLVPSINGSNNDVLHINFYRKAGAYPGTVVMYQAAARIGTTYASVASPVTTSSSSSSSSSSTSTSSSTTSSSTTTSSTTTAGPPVAAFTAAPSPSTTGTAVTFDASTSTCGAPPCTYTWTDAAANKPLGTGTPLVFTFHYAATKRVTLVVTDASGATSTVEHDLVVR